MRAVRPLLIFLMTFWPAAVWGQSEPVIFDYHSVRGRLPQASTSDIFEGETDLANQPRARAQAMRGFGEGWSGDAQLLWDGKLGDQLVASFEIEPPGRYAIKARLTKAPDYGVVEMQFDGEAIARVDLFSKVVELSEIVDLGERNLKAGTQSLVLKLVDANEQASPFRNDRYLIGLDYLKVERLDRPDAVEKPQQARVLEVLSPPEIEFPRFRELLQSHCFACHGDDQENLEGDVDLNRLASADDLVGDGELTSRILSVIQDGTMPPEGESQPTATQRTQLETALGGYLNKYLRNAAHSSPVTMRRLNRYEYNNAVRDLLQLKGDIYPLPEKVIRDDKQYFDPESGRFPRAVMVGNRTLGKNQVEKQVLAGVSPFAIDLQAEHGFNNRGNELSISPLLLESFLKLGQSIVFSPQFDDYCNSELFEKPADLNGAAVIAHAREQISSLLYRAFRSDVEAETLERYAGYFASEYDRTSSYKQSMKAVVAAVLASPRFLFLAESIPVESTQRVSDHELATRLSFFLWSTIPDAELLRAASAGELSDEGLLRAQVERMLADPRSRALSTNFARQWLRLDQLITAVPDFDRFEAYYSRIGCEQWKFGLQTMVEPLLLFESVMVEDRSIMLLIDSNYSYRSDELQSWYKDKTPFGARKNINRFDTFQQAFRRRKLDTRREGGVVTSAAVLTMTSSPLRTSPITRGAWIATVIFNQPPPPPPDAIPEIEADDAEIEAQGVTLRQRLEAHRENDSCVACHAKIDPLGFALENFDAVGRWRDTYRSGLPIDASGKLFGQSEFRDVVELKDAILRRPEWFTRAFCEHMLSYALARELELADKLTVDQMTRRVLADQGMFSTVIMEVALSHPFLHKAKVQR